MGNVGDERKLFAVLYDNEELDGAAEEELGGPCWPSGLVRAMLSDSALMWGGAAFKNAPRKGTPSRDYFQETQNDIGIVLTFSGHLSQRTAALTTSKFFSERKVPYCEKSRGPSVNEGSECEVDKVG